MMRKCTVNSHYFSDWMDKTFLGEWYGQHTHLTCWTIRVVANGRRNCLESYHEDVIQQILLPVLGHRHSLFITDKVDLGVQGYSLGLSKGPETGGALQGLVQGLVAGCERFHGLDEVGPS